MKKKIKLITPEQWNKFITDNKELYKKLHNQAQNCEICIDCFKKNTILLGAKRDIPVKQCPDCFDVFASFSTGEIDVETAAGTYATRKVDTMKELLKAS